ncbi:TetR/AcrR family transcriptional regulator [Amycolatopsis sp. YIM 10]|uniref:TetR/AcrR family transcriptional regulator n=1 Tax=Amycolatopsis sp. YIM 10 TaxID=2653857 RepID=UPI0012903232|nr:TetR/AcrR family transcriptional regulator [Amycolatopsis sp. YIM 10]QFU88181.1 putative HTH-type transcriptional regulator TtgW [Amycolatopsis sp. YIM 10]
MVRLSRAELQEHNRAKVLRAAREEFTERGFRDAKVDAIAERAELTRGAVYSNFPGKRALYFAVLAELAERATAPPHAKPGQDLREALGALARTWVTRLPVGAPDTARLGMDLVSEVSSDERLRRPFAQLMKLDALLLGLAMERLQPPERPPGAPPRRLVRVAESVLTTLHGASRLAASAPGFVEPFDVVSACEQLAGLDLSDWWAAPSTVPTSHEVDEPWTPPEVVDLVRGEAAALNEGVVTILGLHRLTAVEHAVRSADVAEGVTVVLVTSSPDELMPLARLAIAELASCVRSAFPAAAWPRLRVVCDARGTLAAAADVHAVDDKTEAAIRVEGGRIVARADGSGAGHAIANARGKVAN